MFDLVETAKMFAIEAHKEPYDKLPYSYHLSAVVELVKEYNCWCWSDDYESGEGELSYIQLEAAAWLHDVLEDTNRSYGDIARLFGEKIADVVYADRKSTRLNSSHIQKSRMPSSA